MATEWLDEATEILRVLINDMGNNPTYNDNTLEQLILVGAKYVAQEIKLSTVYTVDFLGGTISPDPSNDSDFLNFIVLKGACMTAKWKFDEIAYVQGIKAKLGPAEISVNSPGAVLLATFKEGPCATYEELKLQYNFGRITSIRGILSPFVSNQYQVDNVYIGRF